MNITITLSYFHRKVGPLVYYHYPEQNLEENEKTRIADIMDQANEEGFFSNSVENLYSMNYYFEIFSTKARGKKEMLMVSVILDSNIPSYIEMEIMKICKEFAERVKNNNNSFWAFYSEDDPHFSEEEIMNIKQYNGLMKKWVIDFYYGANEIAREKSEEEKIAILMSQNSIYEIIKFLSNGPIAKEDLLKWFKTKYPDLILDDILDKLEEERFVFINDIGVEIYVLLVKDVKVERIPPDWGITLYEDKPQLLYLTKILFEKVIEFFNDYKPSFQDEMKLLNMVAGSSIYNLLTRLRTGPISKIELMDIDSQEQLEKILKNIEILNRNELIYSTNYEGEIYILLQNDIRFSISFPNYLKKLIPKETKSHVAKSYEPE